MKNREGKRDVKCAEALFLNISTLVIKVETIYYILEILFKISDAFISDEV